jgi:hypothetical protein
VSRIDVRPESEPKTQRYERVRAKLHVRVGAGGTNLESIAENISEGGMYVNTNDPIKPGTRVLVQIEFPDRLVLHRGEVMWAIHVPEHLRDSMICGMGIGFIDPEPGWPEFFRRWRASAAPREP